MGLLQPTVKAAYIVVAVIVSIVELLRLMGTRQRLKFETGNDLKTQNVENKNRP
jgi:hypothetical protein